MYSRDNDLIGEINSNPSLFYSWPFYDYIYLGSKSAIPTALELTLKNFVFLKYWMTKNENLIIPNSQYHYKRAAMFYFDMNEGKFAGIANGFTPE